MQTQVRGALGDHVVLGLEVARNAAGKMRPGGTLIFMGGTGGRRISRELGLVSAATAALPPFTAALALELAPVRVNLIAAGFVDTPLSASLLGDRTRCPAGRAARDAPHRPRRRAGRRRRARRSHHDQHGAHRRDLRHRRRAAVRLRLANIPQRERSRPCALTSHPARTFPDYELPDHESVPRKLSELQGDDPLILTLARGHYCPKEHQQHLELAAFYPKIAVAYTQIATISTDEHHTLQEFRASVGAQWPFLSDPERTVQKDLDIQEYTDPENDPMIPHTLVLKPGLVVHSIYNGYWFWGRPSVVDLWHDLRAVSQRDPPRLGPQRPGAARGLGRGRPLAVPWLEQARRRKPDRRGVEELLAAPSGGSASS